MEAISPRPTAPGDRIEVLDAVRGLAIFGLIFANLRYYAWPVYYLDQAERWPGAVDGLALVAIRFFGEGKAYSLFSILIGLGIVIQLEKAGAMRRFLPLHLRRMLVLLVLGVIHATLIWYGDILILYALLGLVLVAFLPLPPRVILTAAVVCLLLPVAIGGVMMMRIAAAPPAAGAPAPAAAEPSPPPPDPGAQALAAYGSDSLAEIHQQRMRDLRLRRMLVLMVSPHVLGVLLLGVWAGRRRIFRELDEHERWLRRLFAWSLAAGLSGTAASVILKQTINLAALSPAVLVQGTLYGIATPALACAYGSGLVLLWRRGGRFGRALRPLAPVGRLALTNYLLQSVICVGLFYGVGLGLYGRVGPAAGIAVAVAVFAVQVVLSRWWVRRFRFGPAEWLWRSLSYGRLEPLLADRAPAGSPV